MFKHTSLSDASESQARQGSRAQLSEYLLTYSPAHKQRDEPEHTALVSLGGRKEWHHWRTWRHMVRQDTHTHTPLRLWCWMPKKPTSWLGIRGILWVWQSPLNPLAIRVKGSLCDQCDVTLPKCIVRITFLKHLFIYSSMREGAGICFKSQFLGPTQQWWLSSVLNSRVVISTPPHTVPSNQSHPSDWALNLQSLPRILPKVSKP